MTDYTDEELIESIITFYTDSGRWPKLRDMRAPYPSRSTYARRFASAPNMQDGFGRALTMAQIEFASRDMLRQYEEAYKETMNATFGRFGESVNTLKKDVINEIYGVFGSGIGWMNRRIMGFKRWIS